MEWTVRETAAEVSVVFSGPATENGEIDVRDLAPALLALGEIYNAANKALNGEKKVQSAVKVRATAAGSFEVLLNVWQSIPDMVAGFLDFAGAHRDGIVAANELVELIAKVGATGGGLLWLLKWLRGRKPDRIEKRDDGLVSIVVGDEELLVRPEVVTLAENMAVREGVADFATALEKDGIERVTIAAHGPAATEPLALTKDDAPSLKVPAEEEELVTETEQEMALQIVSLSFKEGNKWRFTDGETTFTATIEDEAFLKQVENNERAFAKGDYLICDVRTRQTATPTGLKIERTVIRGKEHRSAARQMRLL